MYKARRRSVLVVTSIFIIFSFIVLSLSLVPPLPSIYSYDFNFTCLLTTALFCVLQFVGGMVTSTADSKLEDLALHTKETALLSEFIDKLHFCYSLDDFYEALGSILEEKADCSVFYIDRIKNYVLYNSPNRLTISKETMFTLELNFSADWAPGYYFLGDNFGVVSSHKKARGILLVNNNCHLFIFCRYTRLFDVLIYPRLFEEFCRFQRRSSTLSDLTEIAELSKEWEQLANTQRSFLPKTIPLIDKLDISAYFKPLVNVSGDYYTVLPINENKTLIMLGDVSGKGLAAALVMGLVMNTVKIMEDKEDLVTIVKSVDKAIKGMKLQDKYTVLFIGIVDTQKMTIRYINASMSDPIVITQSPDGHRIKPLSSNCSIVGIIDLDDIQVAEQRLFRGDVILMASDGVSEVMDDNGVELGTTELYSDTVKKSASKTPREFINNIVELIHNYNGGKKLRDDVTMLVAKVD
ncbi:MAG: SpoIIE family protein phosphatase [Treponema sp.]|nr:SpoIIE family protein phosphatase [Treponema sp.]